MVIVIHIAGRAGVARTEVATDEDQADVVTVIHGEGVVAVPEMVATAVGEVAQHKTVAILVAHVDPEANHGK